MAIRQPSRRISPRRWSCKCEIIWSEVVFTWLITRRSNFYKLINAFLRARYHRSKYHSRCVDLHGNRCTPLHEPTTSNEKGEWGLMALIFVTRFTRTRSTRHRSYSSFSEPCIWKSDCFRCCSVWALIKSIKPSASVKSSRPLMYALNQSSTHPCSLHCAWNRPVPFTEFTRFRHTVVRKCAQGRVHGTGHCLGSMNVTRVRETSRIRWLRFALGYHYNSTTSSPVKLFGSKRWNRFNDWETSSIDIYLWTTRSCIDRLDLLFDDDRHFSDTADWVGIGWDRFLSSMTVTIEQRVNPRLEWLPRRCVPACRWLKQI